VSRTAHRLAHASLAARLCASLLALAALAAPSSRSAAAETREVEWQGVDRVIAFADVHGAYGELVTLLKSVGVIDSDLHWSAGKTWLVSMGDLLDRGDDSRKVMDLLMRLQGEAAAAGGALHIVVGNHEAMNVLGDLRYVSRGDFAAYAADEDPALRAERKAGFLARNPSATDAEFEQRFPPGFFGQRKLLGPDGEYGRWLLAQPAAIVINDTVYMHGGPSAALGNRSIAQLDIDYTAAVSNYLAAESALEEAGLLYFEDAYAKRPDVAQARLQALPADRKATLAPLVARFKAADEDPLLGVYGPNWYRGAALCNECAETDVLDPFVERIGVRRVVVGHTVARNGTVVSRFDGTVIKLDAGMNQAVYHGHPAALILDASGLHVAYANPVVPPAAIPAEPLYLSSQTVSEPEVADILAKGTIETTETCAPGVAEVRVTLDGHNVDGIFEAADGEVVKRELAAYRLDRLLGLGLVPATVARDYEGQAGVLQGRPAHWVSEQDRQNAAKGTTAGLACQTITVPAKGPPARRPMGPQARPARMPAGGWCDLPPQFQLAYAFDALIDNKGRTLDRYLYDADESTLFLSGHGAAFGTEDRLPKPLETALAKTGPEMQARLRRLDANALEGAIGDYVSARDIKAMLERRDRIIEAAKSSPGGGR
jgi:hypothetical protein